MDAHAISLLAIFETKLRLEVPIFQRQYVWGREVQWEPLWEDISRKFNETLQGRQDAPSHFLGAMVLDQKQTPITHVERRLVIDGQQRLTTFQIILAAFRDFCGAQGCSDLQDECDGFILNRGMMSDPPVDRFKVWPTQVDRKQFADVILSKSRQELEKRHPVVRRKYSRYPEPRPRIVEAYLFFYDQLEEFFLGSDTEAPAGAELPIANRLEVCFQALKNSLRVVTIDLQVGDDPQVIFETLNARGEPLLPADLLRNYIFLRAARANENQDILYEEYWRRFDDPFWRQEVRQGRLLRPRSDLFMQHFLASRIGEDIPIKHLFVEYKNWIERQHPFPSITDELKTLAAQGENFRRIINPQRGDPVYQLATFLEAFDIRTAYPLLLTCFAAKIDDSVWFEISKLLESYLVRRTICGMTTKNYNRVFLQLSKNLQRDGVTPENLKAQLASQKGPSAEWPIDSALQESFLESRAYELGNARLVYIFKRLNETYHSAKTEPLLFDRQPTVEHIMPQEWIANWPLGDGSKGLEWMDLQGAEDDDPLAKATRRRNQLVQTFGNLTILMQELNSAQSNANWEDKRPELLKHSLLPINQDLHDATIWNEASITQRAEQLFERVRSIWRGPEV